MHKLHSLQVYVCVVPDLGYSVLELSHKITHFFPPTQFPDFSAQTVEKFSVKFRTVLTLYNFHVKNFWRKVFTGDFFCGEKKTF